jgi:hypothetical protein
LKYRKVFNIINLSLVAGVFLVPFVGLALMDFSLWLTIGCILVSITCGIILVVPDLSAMVKRTAIARFGSHEETDILTHYSDTIFKRIFTTPISTQLDIGNEAQIKQFIESLIAICSVEVLPSVARFYPEVDEMQWKRYEESLLKVAVDSMRVIFFSETSTNPDLSEAAQRLKKQYLFMDETTLQRLVEWWNGLKRRMESQNRQDGGSS